MHVSLLTEKQAFVLLIRKFDLTGSLSFDSRFVEFVPPFLSLGQGVPGMKYYLYENTFPELKRN